MRDLTFLIEDDRYTVPTLRLETLPDFIHPSDAADTVLLESEHHQAVEIHDGIRLLMRRARTHLLPPS